MLRLGVIAAGLLQVAGGLVIDAKLDMPWELLGDALAGVGGAMVAVAAFGMDRRSLVPRKSL